VIKAIGERPALGGRTGQGVVPIAAGRRPYPWNLVALDVEGGCALDVVAVALLVAMRGNQPRINARDRIGTGPWYNVKGQLIARNVADSLNSRRSFRGDPKATSGGFTARPNKPGATSPPRGNGLNRVRRSPPNFGAITANRTMAPPAFKLARSPRSKAVV
jgi:hypothetical protein